MVTVKKQFYSCVYDYAKLFCFDNLTMLLYSKMHQMQDKTPVKMTDYELKIYTSTETTQAYILTKQGLLPLWQSAPVVCLVTVSHCYNYRPTLLALDPIINNSTSTHLVWLQRYK